MFKFSSEWNVNQKQVRMDGCGVMWNVEHGTFDGKLFVSLEIFQTTKTRIFSFTDYKAKD